MFTGNVLCCDDLICNTSMSCDVPCVATDVFTEVLLCLLRPSVADVTVYITSIGFTVVVFVIFY